MSSISRNVKPLTDEEEARIQEQIRNDPENPEWTDEELAQARPFAEVFPHLAESIRRSRGRPKVDAPKVAVTIRMDPDVLAKFKATGKDWRARINEVLEKAEI